MKLYIGIDVGTTSLKALALDENGDILYISKECNSNGNDAK